MSYWILVVLYIGLVLYYAFQTPQTTVSKWPLLQKEVFKEPVTQCNQTSDCPPHSICINNTCVPQLLRGEECYEVTGDWTLVSHRNKTFAACICKYPELITQKHFGGNCDVDVSCGPHGNINRNTLECDCAGDFVSVGHTCQKMTLVEQMKHYSYSCEPDELYATLLRKSDGFTTAYTRKHEEKKCFKRPCTFDAMTGKPLKRARYEASVGCVCDPSLGQFGIRMDGMDDYIQGNGYNACVSIFETPLEQPISVEVFAYFYLLDRPPIVFIQYKDLKSVIAPLKEFVKQGTLQIGQEFPFDYMQAHFRSKQSLDMKVLDKTEWGSLFTRVWREHWKTVPSRMEYCQFISRHLSPFDLLGVMRNKILYHYPACYIGKDDTKVPSLYRNTYVSNPFHVTFPEEPHEHRSNGLVLKFENDKWTLQMAPNYKLNVYSQVIDGVPQWDDPVIEDIKTKRASPKSLMAQIALYDQLTEREDFLNKDET